MEWKKIPKDVNGLYNEEESTMYEELPIIVVEDNCGAAYPFLHYVDKESWYDFIKEFSRSHFNYYAKCNELPFLKTLL